MVSLKAETGVREAVVEIRGKVYKYNEAYVYLKTKENKKNRVPRKYIKSRKVLNSGKEISVIIPREEYESMKFKVLKAKRKRPRLRLGKKKRSGEY